MQPLHILNKILEHMQINNYKMLSKKEIVAEFNVYNEMNRDVLHSKGASNLNSKVCISCNFFQCPAVESPWLTINTNLAPFLLSNVLNINQLCHFQYAIQNVCNTNSRMYRLLEKQGMILAETIVQKIESLIKPTRAKCQRMVL